MSRPRFLRTQGVKGSVPMSDSQYAIASEMFHGWSSEQLTKSELEEIFAIDKAREEAKNSFIKEAKTYPLILTDKCPRCYSEEMNIYKINDLGYFCQCQRCNVSCSTKDYISYLDRLEDSIWPDNSKKFKNY